MDSKSKRLFSKVVEECNLVACLGEKQKMSLVNDYHLPSDRVHVIHNVYEGQILSEHAACEKHVPEGSLKCLHLGTLMETKGYVALMDSISDIPERCSITIAGNLARSPFDTIYSSLEEQKADIQSRVRICPRLDWIDGVSGEAKLDLYRSSHVFVLPTSFDAQPLVLLEAIAYGLVIITSDVGEILEIVDSSSAIILADNHPDTVARAIALVADDVELRKRLVVNARTRLLEGFMPERFRQEWQAALQC
jgi:glycosyltransferase involved in cell wall biosynthesis